LAQLIIFDAIALGEGATVHVHAGHLGDVVAGDKLTAGAFSRGGRWALTGSEDRTARAWDLNTAREIQRFEGHTEGNHFSRHCARWRVAADQQ